MLALLADNPMVLTLLLLLAAASMTDLASRKIPNVLVCVGFVAALAGHIYLAGLNGIGVTLAGGLVGLLCLLPFYLLGGMGAGDVKLMAVCGGFIGPVAVFWASVATLFVGCVIGVVMACTSRRALAAESGKLALIGLETPHGVEQRAENAVIPYALAISLGVLLELSGASSVMASWVGGNP
jgi:prepilin peptidase CpaA